MALPELTQKIVQPISCRLFRVRPNTEVKSTFINECNESGVMPKMAEEAGSELVAFVRDNLNKVKQVLLSRSNKDKTLKEEAAHEVSEMDSLLNRLIGKSLGLECTLKKALTTAEKEKYVRIVKY
jgi:hypothetical protein